jgi:CxxC motif-containing protein
MRTLPAIISVVKKLPAPKYLIPDNCPRWLRKIIFWAPVRYNFGDVIISSPKGTDDDVVLSKIENPEELINYLSPIKPQPTEVASYSANR